MEEFGSPLIVVLGHERCGAITATINAIRSVPGELTLPTRRRSCRVNRRDVTAPKTATRQTGYGA
ncbi:hypothetical protein [Micromonospora sp. NPDC048830]|uniref:hypothetical protein n=1 Tax=Micromonospora sp. NPDC048830 TaxID=3364257 RepID=UPI0037150E68